MHSIVTFLFTDQTKPNSFQAVLATDGTRSYAIYTYKCGELNWVKGFSTSSSLAGIGFSASSDLFAEHSLSRNSNVNQIACINEDSIPPSNWSNIVYEIGNTGQYIFTIIAILVINKFIYLHNIHTAQSPGQVDYYQLTEQWHIHNMYYTKQLMDRETFILL